MKLRVRKPGCFLGYIDFGPITLSKNWTSSTKKYCSLTFRCMHVEISAALSTWKRLYHMKGMDVVDVVVMTSVFCRLTSSVVNRTGTEFYSYLIVNHP